MATPSERSNTAPEQEPVGPTRREPAETEVAQRAYDIFMARGSVHGYDVDDWLQARAELEPTDER